LSIGSPARVGWAQVEESSMAARPRKQHVRRAKQDLYRQLVLEAAGRVFAEKGYDRAKMEEIARESGLSPGTLYTVFDGKADVYRALHEAGDEELLRCGIEAARGIEDPVEVLLAGIRGYVGYFLAHPDFLQIHLREGFTWGTEQSGAQSQGRTRAWRQGIDALTGAVQRCIDARAFHPGDPGIQARMMIAMQQVQLAHWVEERMARPPEEVIQDVEAHVRRAFCS
jgi:AcrR family transcriptional regulator